MLINDERCMIRDATQRSTQHASISMLADFRQLVEEITDLTGAAPPPILEEDAPVLSADSLRAEQSMYLIGLIGGKDVGKSSVVNALVGCEITPRTSHGPGTETVIAYAHEDQVPDLRALLDREVPGQYCIVTHDLPGLRRQVLLDLPDIDSHYASHVEITRRMLRHMLFPIWMQSVEKYADQRPRELLALVAAGNAPQNFIFCLNKADQIIQREGPAAARELADDFAARLARQLKLPGPPKVWLISAMCPEIGELHSLRELLMQERSEQALDLSRSLAVRQQGLSLAEWVDRQGLEQRLAALDRLQTAAEEELASRIGVPLVDVVLPRLIEDPAYRLGLVDEIMRRRVSRWPIVNILHVLLAPLISILRRRLPIDQQRGLAGAEPLVGLYLHQLPASRAAPADAPGGASVAALLQSAFAILHQSSPQLGRLYADRKLWESMPADLAQADLRQRIAATVERQRSILRSRVGSGGPIGALFRFLLTIGALLWFPFVQPLLEAWLSPESGSLLVLAVQLFGVTYLLKNVSFLAIYFVILWLILRWDTQRKVEHWLVRWQAGDHLDPTLSLAGQVVEWSNDVLAPIRTARQRMSDLVGRASELRRSLTQSEAA